MKKAFSLIELLIAIIIISIITASFAPVLTKRLKKHGVSISQKGLSFDKCTEIDENCEICIGNTCYGCSKTCAANEYKDVAKCKCVNCTAAYGSMCIKCNADECKTCLSGYEPNGSNCTPCAAGQFSDGESKCKQCEYNYYQPNTAKSSCLPCGSGKYTDTKGATGCKNCSDTFGIGCSSCTKDGCSYCKSGYGYNSSTKKCESCGSNQYSTGGLGGCSTCGAGTQVNANKNGCDSTCGDGTYYDIASNSCVSCSTKFSGCTSCSDSACLVCGPNYSLLNKECVLSSCKVGEYLDNGACKSCALKFHLKCTKCNSTECTECDTTTHVLKKGTCYKRVTESDCNTLGGYWSSAGCITKYNFGVTGYKEIAIPSSAGVTLKNIGGNCGCNSEDADCKCCWRATSDANTSGSGCTYSNITYNSSTKIAFDYTACKRTVCNKQAASAICENYDGGGKQGYWELPSHLPYEPGVGKEGGQFCHGNASAMSTGGLAWCPQKGTNSCKYKDKYSDGELKSADPWPFCVATNSGRKSCLYSSSHGFEEKYIWSSSELLSIRCAIYSYYISPAE